MNEAPKPTNRWKSIAIVALVVALIACGVVVYLLNRPVPETPVLTSIDRPALQAEPQAEPTAEPPSALQAEPQAEPTAEPIFDVTEVPKPAEAPLSLWTDGALARESLQAYMDMITSDGVGYIPPEDRIAVFDLDGTLFCETDPVYFDYSLLLYRVTQDEAYKDKASDFERQTAKKIQDMILTGKSAPGLEVDHGKCVASAFAGMTIPEFEAYCKKFRELPARGYEGMTIGEGFYRPMLQVVDYLVANDFKVYVVSGTDRLIVRGIVKDSLLKVPMEQIIGSDETLVARQQGDADGLDYVFTKGDDVVLGGEFIVKNLKMNKVTVILQEIGKQPVLSFGNSTGDASMAEFVTNNNPYPSMAFMLCCDDEVRENGSATKAEKMAKLCAQFDWVPISMKDDWTTIYGDGVTRKATPDNVIFDIPEKVQESDVKLSDDASDFVLLSEAVPDAILEIRYYSTYNFIGDRIDGYEEPLALLTKEAAAALREVSDELLTKGYRLKIFDAYRPQRAVTNFMNWALDPDDARMKEYFYPELEKDVLFPQGYIAEHSGHSRGSTVDLTLFDMRTEREVDMGGTFDYFGQLSHPDYTEITAEQYAMRMLLREVMLKHGFKPLEEEWWHFTLNDEPFPDTYFTFPVNSESVPPFDPAAMPANTAAPVQDEMARPTSAPADIDYLALVNKVSALPEGWEDALKTVTVTNSVNDAVTVEQKAYDAYLKLKDDLEKNDGIYLELDSAFRSVAQQEDIMTRFIEKYGEDYATKTVAQPGYSEHHTGLALDLYFKLKNEDGTFTDVYHNEDMEKAEYAPIWEKIHSKLADYGFILRYLPGLEHITGYRHELWHIRYVDSVEVAKAIMAEPAMTLEEYLKGQRAPEAAIDLSGSALYSPEELTDAMLAVKCKFAAFAGCELHSIRYGGDEAATEENLAWLNSHKEKASYTKVMKLLTNFHTDADILGAWEPDQEYTDYQWWLGFNAKGEWEIVDWGY